MKQQWWCKRHASKRFGLETDWFDGVSFYCFICFGLKRSNGNNKVVDDDAYCWNAVSEICQIGTW